MLAVGETCVNSPTMLEMAASVWLANSKKFSTHVDEPAFGTLSMDEDDGPILFGYKI